MAQPQRQGMLSLIWWRNSRAGVMADPLSGLAFLGLGTSRRRHLRYRNMLLIEMRVHKELGAASAPPKGLQQAAVPYRFEKIGFCTYPRLARRRLVIVARVHLEM